MRTVAQSLLLRVAIAALSLAEPLSSGDMKAAVENHVWFLRRLV